MLIRNTEVEATQPWPEDMFIQGGSNGLVLGRGDHPSYTTAFVEVCPKGTFIRGEGSTIQEAELSAWNKYQTYVNCDGTGLPHGPYEARSYQNGSGFCTRCGTWASKVLPPSLRWECGEQAYQNVKDRYGENILWHPRRAALVKEEEDILFAEATEAPVPDRTVEPPTSEEMREMEDEESGKPDFATFFNLLLNLDTPKKEDI